MIFLAFIGPCLYKKILHDLYNKINLMIWFDVYVIQKKWSYIFY
jgi:hypothetical protein